MPVRAGKIYKAAKDRPYTRKEYLKGVPEPKITIFDMGDANGDFEIEVSLVGKERAQITHAAMEAMRIASNRHLNNNAGRTGYHLKIRVYPHQVLRENKMATGAGADRVQDGMRKSFGKIIGTAARVKKGQKLVTVKVNTDNFQTAKDALRRASNKLPLKCSIEIDKGQELLP